MLVTQERSLYRNEVERSRKAVPESVQNGIVIKKHYFMSPHLAHNGHCECSLIVEIFKVSARTFRAVYVWPVQGMPEQLFFSCQYLYLYLFCWK